MGGGGFPFGAPIPPWSGFSPASLAGPCRPGLPPFAAVLGPVFSLSSRGALVRFVRCFFFFCVSTVRRPSLPLARRSVLCPPPMSPRHLLDVLAPFLGGWGRRGWGGGDRPRCPSSGVSTSQARRRHEVRHLSFCRGGGGLPCGSRRRPSYPAFAPPVPPPLGLPRRVLPSGTVVWSVPHTLSAASPPCRFVLGGGGGGALSAPPFLHPPPLGGRRCVWGGGLALSSSLRCTHVAGTTQARRRHEARHLSLCRGGGHALWLP